MNYLIVDDDPDFAGILRGRLENSRYFRTESDTVRVVTRAEELTTPLLLSSEVIFADICLGGRNRAGIDLAARLSSVNPDCRVIFISSYLKYATDVYDTDHIYFIYKPELDKRLDNALARALTSGGREPRLLSVSFNGRETAVRHTEILYIEQYGRVANIVCAGRTLQTYKKLDELVQALDDPDFCRCHKSYAVNLSHVCAFAGSTIRVDGGAVVKVSRSHASETRAAFADYCARGAGGGAT